MEGKIGIFRNRRNVLQKLLFRELRRQISNHNLKETKLSPYSSIEEMPYLFRSRFLHFDGKSVLLRFRFSQRFNTSLIVVLVCRSPRSFLFRARPNHVAHGQMWINISQFLCSIIKTVTINRSRINRRKNERKMMRDSWHRFRLAWNEAAGGSINCRWLSIAAIFPVILLTDRQKGDHAS